MASVELTRLIARSSSLPTNLSVVPETALVNNIGEKILRAPDLEFGPLHPLFSSRRITQILRNPEKETFNRLRTLCAPLNKFIYLIIARPHIESLDVLFSKLFDYCSWKNSQKDELESYKQTVLLPCLNTLGNFFLKMQVEIDFYLKDIESLYGILTNYPNQDLLETLKEQWEKVPQGSLPYKESTFSDVTIVEDIVTKNIFFLQWIATDFVPSINGLFKLWAEDKRSILIELKKKLANTALIDPEILEQCFRLLNKSLSSLSLNEICFIKNRIEQFKEQERLAKNPAILVPTR